MSSNIAIQRIKREFLEVAKFDEANQNLISIESVNGSLVDLRGKIAGPPDTPYAGGIYYLEIKISETYPFNPPKVRFITRVWHPNVSSATGAICLDILKDQWAAAMTLRTVLLSLQALLQEAQPDDPQDSQVAKQLLNNKDEFVKTAHYWKMFFATNSTSAERMKQHPVYESKFIEFKNHPIVKDTRKGENELLGILSSSYWDINRALQML